MQKHLRIYGAALSILLLSFPGVSAFAQQSKWLQLGSGRTSAASTSAYIPSSTARGTVCAIRFVSQSGGFELDEVTVHFGNSQTLHISTHSTVAGNSPSQAISLRGEPRTVKGVDIVYRRLEPKAAGSNVELWGNAISGTDTCP